MVVKLMLLAIVGISSAQASTECFDRIKPVNGQVVGQKGSWSQYSSSISESDYLIGINVETQMQLLSLPTQKKVCLDAIPLQSYSEESQSPVFKIVGGGDSVAVEHFFVNRTLVVKSLVPDRDP